MVVIHILQYHIGIRIFPGLIYIYTCNVDVNFHDTSINEMFFSQYRELRAIGIMKGC